MFYIGLWYSLFHAQNVFWQQKHVLFICSSSSCFLLYYGLHTWYDIYYSASFLTFLEFIPAKAFYQNIPIFIYNYFSTLKYTFHLRVQVISIPYIFGMVCCYYHVNSDIYLISHVVFHKLAPISLISYVHNAHLLFLRSSKLFLVNANSL